MDFTVLLVPASAHIKKLRFGSLVDEIMENKVCHGVPRCVPLF